MRQDHTEIIAFAVFVAVSVGSASWRALQPVLLALDAVDSEDEQETLVFMVQS